MSSYFDTATLGIVLSGVDHSSADVALLAENVQALISASLWASISDPNTRDERLTTARNILARSLETSKAGSRFYPTFNRIFRESHALPFDQPAADSEGRDPSSFDREFEVGSALDMGTLVGVNSWMRREILAESPDLYREVFDFAKIQHVEHNSPLLLEIAIVLGAAVAVPVILTYGLMRAVARAKRMNVEAEIREVELADKRLALKQREIQTVLLEEVTEAFQQQRKRHPDYQVPESVITSAVQIAAPAVADFGSSPLIEKVTFSASIGGKL